MKRLLLIACVLVFSSINNGANASSQAQLSGLNYLSTAQNVDGSWSGDIASDFYSTAAVLETLKIYNNGGTSYQSGFQWCQAYPVWNVDYLARKIILLSQNNLDYSDALTTLFSLRNTENSGWGLKSYTNDIFDTAFALESLSSAKYSDATILYQALSYLTLSQNPDGGWGSMSGGPSSAYVTAWVLKALIAYNSVFLLHDPINKASAYLLTKQNVDGGFGSSPSNVYETALSVMSLIESGKGGAETIQSGIQYLTTTQASDGSWSQDPYYTALALQALAAARPNLMVSSISLSNPMPQENVETTITATIKNAGYEDASNIVVRFYFGDPSSGGVQIGSDQIIPTLIINSSTQVSATASFTGTGGKTIFVVSDPDNTISETSEADNKSSTRIWVATAPDLAVFSEDLKPSTYVPAPGTAFTLAYTVRNLGESAADAFAVSLYDGDPTAGGTLLQSANISGLVGTETRAGTFGVTFTGDGPHTLYLAADSDNHITELSETNNTGTVTIQVGGVQQYADLVAGNITIAPDRPHANDLVTITASVRNEGLEDASSFTVELFDGAPESGGTLIHSQIVSLSSGTNQTISANWTILSGIHDIYLIADRSNQINETNETNNQTSVKVMTDMVDITVSATDLTFTPAHPVNGDTVVLNITVHNQGIKDTGPFNLALYDGDPASGGALLQTFTISNIAADGSTTLPYTFTAIPWTYRFYAIADTENTVTELYEDNNTAIRSLKIKAPGEILGPDLVPVKIDLSSMTTDPRTLVITGTAAVTFQNKGDDKITTSFDLLVFEDTDLDARYTPGMDNVLGTGTNTTSLWPEGAGMVNVPLTGNVKFLHSPLYAFVDSGDAVLEQNETNNHLISCKDCEKRPVNPIEPVVKWKKTGMEIFETPVIAPLIDSNGDGNIDDKDVPGIIFKQWLMDHIIPSDEWKDYSDLWAIRGDTGSTIFHIHDPSYKISWDSTPLAVGDIDADGLPETVLKSDCNSAVTGYTCGLRAYDHNGNLKWDNTAAVNQWKSAHGLAGWSPFDIRKMPPLIADLDHNGKPEIVFGMSIINPADGSITWASANYQYYQMSVAAFPTVADIDLDGKQEMIFGNAAINSDGTLKWWNTSLGNMGYLAGSKNVAVGRFSDDPYPELVLVTHSYNAPTGAAVYLLDHRGQIKWGPVNIRNLDTSDPWNCSNILPPLIADFDGDGEPEIGVRGGNRYFALDKNGNLKQKYVLPDAYPDDATPTVFDLNGDGRPEVLINANHSFMIFDGITGSRLYSESFWQDWPRRTWSKQNVIVADVDADGKTEAVVASDDGIKVYESKNHDWVGARRVWNQYDYHVTNVNDDGSIPQYESPSWLMNNTYLTQARVGESPNPYLTPNFTASYLRVQQDSATLNLTVRIGNGGAKEAAPGASVSFYNGPSSGSLLGTVYTTRTLQPGEYEDITYSIGSGYAGISIITAVVDQANTISECREDDNQVSLSVGSGSGMPDLAIGSENITLSSGPYYEGSSVTGTANIINAGYYPATNASVRLYDGNPASGGSQIGSTQTISSLEAGVSATVSFSFDTLGKGGTHVLYVVIDSENAIAETNEGNNSASVTIDIQEPVLPNLLITAIALSSSSLKEGDQLTVSATILNRGAGVSGVPVRIKINSSSRSQTEIIYPILTPSQAATVEATFETIGLSGTQTVLVEVDPDNAITESIETDNTASATISIQSAGLATTLSINKTQYSANSDMQITFTVNNNNALAWSGTGEVNIEDTAGDLLATAATFSVEVQPSWAYRAPATMTAAWDMKDVLAAVDINFSDMLTGLGVPAAAVDKNSIRVQELDSTGNIIGEKQAQTVFKNDTNAMITWLVDGTTANNTTRYFAVYFDTTDHGQKQPSDHTKFPKTGKGIAFSDETGKIYVLESEGNGAFTTPGLIDDVTTSAADNVRGVVLADFNGDGFVDIITGTGTNGDLYYYQNNADGSNTFLSKIKIGTISAASYIMDMAVADFNNDGKPDFAVSGNNTTLSLFLGAGPGTFTQSSFAAPSGTTWLRGKAAGDVDLDGKPDLIIADCGSGKVYLYKGKGDGTFHAPIHIATSGTDPYGLVIGDFDEDGNPDVIANTGQGGESNFFRGKGDGAFAASTSIATLDTNNYAAYDVGDFNNDGHLDILAITAPGNTLDFYPGKGDATFGLKVTVTSVYSTLGITASPALAEVHPVLGIPENVPGQTYQFTWNTGGTTPGQYQVHATLSEGAGAAAENKVSFEILADVRAAAKVVTDKIQYNPNETATITSTITSNSANYVFENLSAKLTISSNSSSGLNGSNGSYTETKTLTTLMPGAAYAYKSHWNTASNPAGSYTVSLEVRSGDTVISTSAASLQILSSSNTGGGLAGTILATPSPVYQGREETFTYSITNSGNEDVTSLGAAVIIVDPETGEIKTEVRSQETGVRRGETITATQKVSTMSLAPKNYLAVLQVQTAAMAQPKTLASAVFEVKPGIEAAKKIPDVTNLLVWINEKCEKNGGIATEDTEKNKFNHESTPMDANGKSQESAVSSQQSEVKSRECGTESLEEALRKAVTDYRIVYDKKDFQAELRNPYYTDFLILGDHQHLEDHFAEEFREQVYSGKGLILSPYHQEQLEKEIFNIKADGHLPGTEHPVQLTGSELGLQGTFQTYGRTAKVKDTEATNVLAWITVAAGKETVQYPAVIKRQYGQGKALYLAFDLAMSSKDTVSFPALLEHAVEYVHRPINNPEGTPHRADPGRLVPIEITIKSLGGAFDIRVTETYPEEIRQYDPEFTDRLPAGTWTRDLRLDPDQTKTILYYALTPDKAGTYTLATEVGYMENGEYAPYQTLSIDLIVDKDIPTATQETISAMTALPVSRNDAEKIAEAIKHTEKAQKRVIAEQEDMQKNIHDLLKAADALLSVTSADTAEVRLMLDNIILFWEAEWYYYPSPPGQ